MPLRNVPPPPSPDFNVQIWDVAYKLACIGRLRRPPLDLVASQMYSLVMTGTHNSDGLGYKEYGDAIASEARKMRRFGRNKQKKIAYLLGATQTTQHRALCKDLMEVGEDPLQAIFAIRVLADSKQEKGKK